MKQTPRRERKKKRKKEGKLPSLRVGWEGKSRVCMCDVEFDPNVKPSGKNDDGIGEKKINSSGRWKNKRKKKKIRSAIKTPEGRKTNKSAMNQNNVPK
jgi:hypothetical protein